MSERIRQTIEVMKIVKDSFIPGDTLFQVSRKRINSEHKIAIEHDITKQSIQSKYITQMKPHIKSARHFDELLHSWLSVGSPELRDVLLAYTNSDKDLDLIRSLFPESSFEDIHISAEFDYEPEDIAYREGKSVYRIHLSKERNRTLVKKAKAIWYRQNNGNIKCFVCKFSFTEFYGELGDGFIEVHHEYPMSQLSEETVVRVNDLRPICANCHRMLHRYRLALTCDELKRKIQEIGA